MNPFYFCSAIKGARVICFVKTNDAAPNVLLGRKTKPWSVSDYDSIMCVCHGLALLVGLAGQSFIATSEMLLTPNFAAAP